MVSESVRKAILSNPGISESQKAPYRTSSSSRSSSSGSSSSSSTKDLGGGLKGIYVNGQLTGVEDTLKQQSRTPTASEKLIFGSLGGSSSSGGSSSGSSSGGGQSISAPASPGVSKPSSVSTQGRKEQTRRSLISSPTQIKQKLTTGTRKVFQDIPLSTLGQLQAREEKLIKQKEELIKEQGLKRFVSPIAKLESKKIDSQLKAIQLAKVGMEGVLIPAGLINLIKDPKQLKDIPSSLKEEAIKTGKLARVSPGAAVVKIGAEVFLLKGTGKSLKIVGKVPKKTAAKLTGKLAKIEESTIIIGKKVGKKTGKEALEIKIAKPGLKKIETPLKKQAALSGKKIPVVTSAQADRLIPVIKSKRVIRKPIPNEKFLKPATKKLLKRFDEGKLTKNQLIALDRKIKLETKGAGSLLERSFFVDPKGRVRLSRLGLQKEAGLFDIVRGNFTLKTQKPQILIFRDIKVQNFPKTPIFNQIRKRLNANKRLTKKQADALLKFQLKKSGKFKPIGALTKEPELTAAPGEIVKKVKTVAYVEINGELVPIVQSKIVKATKTTKKLLKKAKEGKITKKELKELEKRLKKETGFTKSDLKRRGKPKPRLSTRRKTATGLTRVSRLKGKIKLRKIKKRKPVRKKTTSRKPKRTIVRKPKRPVRKTAPKTRPRTAPRRIPRRIKPAKTTRRVLRRKVTRQGTKKKTLILGSSKKLKKIKRSKKQKSYNVFARPLKRRRKQKGRTKLLKVNKKPLTKKQAEDLKAYVLDTSLARTGSIKPTKGKPGKDKLNVPKGYSARTKRKFRSFRVIKGKKKRLPKGTVIEKSRNLLDTLQEKRKISLAKRIAQINRPVRKRKTIKRSNISKSQMLRNLAKARKVRMNNLKRSK